MPKVSVIIPTYNRAQMVCEAIDSVLAQTLEDAEVIVVDDGSTDGTGEVLRQRYGDRIRYLYQENRGRAVARNRGIQMSHGKYLLFLDSDDWLLPRALEQEATYLDVHPDVDVVYTDGFFCDEQGRHLLPISAQRPKRRAATMLDELVLHNVIVACHSAMVRRAALEALEYPYFDIELRGTEDEDLWIRLAAAGRSFVELRVPTCKYRVHSGNDSRYDSTKPTFQRRQQSVRRSRFKILYADFFPSLPLEVRWQFLYKMLLFYVCNAPDAREEVLASQPFLALPAERRAALLYYLGVSTIVADGDLALGRKRLAQAAALAPGNLKFRLGLALSYLGRRLFAAGIALRRRLGGTGREVVPASPIHYGVPRLV